MAPSAVRKLNASRPSKDRPAQHGVLASVGPAYEPTFLEAVKPALPYLQKYGIRVAVNAGGSDPQQCHEVLEKMIREQGLQIPTAWIDGDDVMSSVQQALKGGKSEFSNIHTEKPLKDWSADFEMVGAQAYLGGMGIAEAFSRGAQIVICGRVSDASPYIGSAFWWHGWKRDMLDELANVLMAGHLLECSTYVTGGNYAGFQELQFGPNAGWRNLGYPIGEIGKDGSVIITKQRGTEGKVTVNTCSSQVLYEIQGVWYFNSDVTAVINDIWFEQLGPDRVALHGVTALPPPPTTKVGVTALGGYQAESLWFLTGLDIPAKARMLEAQVRSELKPYSDQYTLLKFHIIGSARPDADTQDAATVCLRIIAQARTAAAVSPARFLRPITDNIMQPYPGGTYHLDIRQGLPKPFYEYYSMLYPQSEVQHVVHHNGKDTPIPPPPKSQQFSPRPPSQPSTGAKVDLKSFGPTKRLPLGTIAYARSGDKGSDCNCGLWIRNQNEEAYSWLRNLLSIAYMKVLMYKELDMVIGTNGDDSEIRRDVRVERFELPNLKGVHFLFRNLLDRGVTSTSGIDFLGKNLGEFLRQREVDIPVKFLQQEGAKL